MPKTHNSWEIILAGVLLTTSGGHISLDEAKGNMEVETSGGNIEGSNLTGSLKAETSGGNIKTGFQEVQGDIILQTSAGNITLNVPQKTSADVNLEGAQVDIGSVFNFSGVKDTGEASGTINGGGATRIDCKTSIGNVTLSGNPNI